MQNFFRLKSDPQKDFAAAGYLFEAPSKFLFWGGYWVSNFVGLEFYKV
jgi:hypothetical protein